MSTRRQNCVYVIGAGFSAGLGYPLTGDLLMQFWDRLRESPFKRSLRRVIAFHNPNFNGDDFGTFPNVEELLSQMTVNAQLFDFSRQHDGHFTKGELEDLHRTFLLRIAGWFHEISEEVRPTRPKLSWLATFRDKVRSENVGIISFNWDLVLDELLFGTDVDGTSYGFPLHAFERPVLIKPHGSLNWFEDHLGQHIKADRKFLLTGENEKRVYAFRKFRAPQSSKREYTPLIVPPVHSKNFDKPVFRHLWRQCTKLLSTADRVVFLGYSMSTIDFHAQFIMRCGFQNQVDGELVKGGRRGAASGPAEVVVVNPDRTAALRTRGVAGPQHRCRWISRPIASLTWADL